MTTERWCARCIDGVIGGWSSKAAAGYCNHSTVQHVAIGLQLLGDPRLSDSEHRVVREAVFAHPEASVALLLLCSLRWLDQEPDAASILRGAGL